MIEYMTAFFNEIIFSKIHAAVSPALKGKYFAVYNRHI